jgi:hypothetical protein
MGIGPGAGGIGVPVAEAVVFPAGTRGANDVASVGLYSADPSGPVDDADARGSWSMTTE